MAQTAKAADQKTDPERKRTTQPRSNRKEEVDLVYAQIRNPGNAFFGGNVAFQNLFQIFEGILVFENLNFFLDFGFWAFFVEILTRFNFFLIFDLEARRPHGWLEV